MDEIVESLTSQGHKLFLIPVGASNAVGAFGHAAAIEEITKQENEVGYSGSVHRNELNKVCLNFCH